MVDQTETAKPAPAPKPAGLRWKWAFWGLLSVNLLALGVIGGMIAKGPPMGERAVRDLGFGLYGEAMDEGDRKALKEGFFEKGPRLRDLRKVMQADLTAVLTALRAEPFDPAALDAAFAAQTARIEEKILLGQTLLRDHLVQMTPEQRHAFADRLERSARRQEHRDKKDDKDDHRRD